MSWMQQLARERCIGRGSGQDQPRRRAYQLQHWPTQPHTLTLLLQRSAQQHCHQGRGMCVWGGGRGRRLGRRQGRDDDDRTWPPSYGSNRVRATPGVASLSLHGPLRGWTITVRGCIVPHAATVAGDTGGAGTHGGRRRHRGELCPVTPGTAASGGATGLHAHRHTPQDDTQGATPQVARGRLVLEHPVRKHGQGDGEGQG